MPLGSVSVIIPSYNMAWCVTRAIKSCQAQSLAADEIIVVDDCSTDNTEGVIRDLMTHDSKVKYHRLEQNGGHMAALKVGALAAASDWIALLDADDELTPNSIEARVVAANEYIETTGTKPQLVYGDHEDNKFPRLKGYVFPYLCKELSLCQTSTMMLGKECVPHLPDKKNWNSDDRIVLAVGEHFHVLHSGVAATIYHRHDSSTRLSNNAYRVFEGVYRLVRDYHADIVREHGIRCLVLWWLRILNAFVRYQLFASSAKIAALDSTFAGRCQKFILRIYVKELSYIRIMLKSFLNRYFENDFF